MVWGQRVLLSPRWKDNVTKKAKRKTSDLLRAGLKGVKKAE